MYRARLLLLIVSLFAFSACSSLREDLGLGRSAPDEFAVIDRPPLAMPPDFALRPQSAALASPASTEPPQKAAQSLYGADPSASKEVSEEPSTLEKAILTNVNADKIVPGIRDIVDQETSQKVVLSKPLVQSLLDWGRGDHEQPATVVNASAEAERIKAAKEKGQPLNQGNTPVIEMDKSGWLGL